MAVLGELVGFLLVEPLSSEFFSSSMSDSIRLSRAHLLKICPTPSRNQALASSHALHAVTWSRLPSGTRGPLHPVSLGVMTVTGDED